MGRLKAVAAAAVVEVILVVVVVQLLPTVVDGCVAPPGEAISSNCSGADGVEGGRRRREALGVASCSSQCSCAVQFAGDENVDEDVVGVRGGKGEEVQGVRVG